MNHTTGRHPNRSCICHYAPTIYHYIMIDLWCIISYVLLLLFFFYDIDAAFRVIFKRYVIQETSKITTKSLFKLGHKMNALSGVQGQRGARGAKLP